MVNSIRKGQATWLAPAFFKWPEMTLIYDQRAHGQGTIFFIEWVLGFGSAAMAGQRAGRRFTGNNRLTGEPF
jgi:hypothetical protein